METKYKIIVVTPQRSKQVDALKGNIFSRKPVLVGMELSEVGLFRWTDPVAHEIAEYLQAKGVRIVSLFDKGMHTDLEASKLALALRKAVENAPSSHADAADLQEQLSEQSDIPKLGLPKAGSDPADAAARAIGIAQEMQQLFGRATELYDEHGLQKLQELNTDLEQSLISDAIRRIKEELPAVVLSTDNKRGMRLYQGLISIYGLEFLEL